MIGLDTNVLLRYLTQDDPEQSRRATEIIEGRLTEEEPGFVSIVSILEVVWVLKSIFKRSPQEIANDIEMLLAADSLGVPQNGCMDFNWSEYLGARRPKPYRLSRRPSQNRVVHSSAAWQFDRHGLVVILANHLHRLAGPNPGAMQKQ